MPLLDGLAAWLRAALIHERVEKGWTYEQAARAISRVAGRPVSRQTVEDWEKQRRTREKLGPALDQFDVWARGLGMSLDVTLSRTSDEHIPLRLPTGVVDTARSLQYLTAEQLDTVSRVVDGFLTARKRSPSSDG